MQNKEFLSKALNLIECERKVSTVSIGDKQKRRRLDDKIKSISHDEVTNPRKRKRACVSVNQETGVARLGPVIAGKNGKTVSSRLVRFATPLVQNVFHLPSLATDELSRCFYTRSDFTRFAWNEQLRQKAIILAIIFGRIQMKRLKAGHPLLPHVTVHQLYHTVIARIGSESLLTPLPISTEIQQHQKAVSISDARNKEETIRNSVAMLRRILLETSNSPHTRRPVPSRGTLAARCA